jgi:Ca-activated chloride channel family protein
MTDSALHINWNDFHFLRPVFLWLLIPAVIVLIVGLFGIREEVKWKNVIAPHLRNYIIKKGSENIKRRMQILSFIVIAIAILGIAGPTWDTVEIPGQTLETPVVVLLDMSQSMMAEDIQPNRLERAKFKITDLLDANPRARIALVGFSGTAHTIIPLTSDYQIIKSHLDGLSPQMMPFPGTNLEDALLMVDTITAVTKAPATIILFTDDFDDNTFTLIQQFSQQHNSKFEIMPVNTLSGSDVPNPNGNGVFKDKSGENVHSSLNTEILGKINSLNNVDVHQLTLDNSDMELLAKNISSNLEFKEQDEKKEDDWKDRGLWLVIPFAVFLLMWFRKGWVIYSLAIFMVLSSCSTDYRFADLWFTKDYQAQQLYNQGKFEEAAELYADPLHKGVAYFKSGNFGEAINYFSKDTTAEGAYNLGLAYLKNGDYAAAELAFGKAVEMDPEMESARKSKDAVTQLMAGSNEASLEEVQEAQEAEEKQKAQNEQNTSPEDLSGGGQEATEKDMEKERLEETVATDIMKGKELEEVPEDFEMGKADESQKVLMRKVDDDPSLFLKRKFAHQVKTKNIQPNNDGKEW